MPETVSQKQAGDSKATIRDDNLRVKAMNKVTDAHLLPMHSSKHLPLHTYLHMHQQLHLHQFKPFYVDSQAILCRIPFYVDQTVYVDSQLKGKRRDDNILLLRAGDIEQNSGPDNKDKEDEEVQEIEVEDIVEDA